MASRVLDGVNDELHALHDSQIDSSPNEPIQGGTPADQAAGDENPHEHNQHQHQPPEGQASDTHPASDVAGEEHAASSTIHSHDRVTTVATQALVSVEPDVDAVVTSIADLLLDEVCSGWPAYRIPLELFDNIARHLDRVDVENMRLVNREFEQKLSSNFFRNVVVTFRPVSLACLTEAAYSNMVGLPTNHEQSACNAALKTMVKESFLSGGIRVLKDFGQRDIKKFALALELDDGTLAAPPLKLDQRIISTPMGLYRWPVNGHTQLQQPNQLETIAGETEFMEEALSHLKAINEIGISCDGGLGYMPGPSFNTLARPVAPAVFRSSRFSTCRNSLTSQQDDHDLRSRSRAFRKLRQMAINAGFNRDNWHWAAIEVLENENKNEICTITPEGIPLLTKKYTIIPVMSIKAIHSIIEKLVEGESTGVNSSMLGLDITPCRILPVLMPGQIEMLVELAWAHRTLLDSFVTAVTANEDVFVNLKTLTIARIPGCHLPIFMNSAFWSALKSLERFSLGVIPDWRAIDDNERGKIVETRVSPGRTYNIVHDLLDFVGHVENIKSLHFEWICGGEFALGIGQRDRYILPAPLVFGVYTMVINLNYPTAVILPHVKRLSLKNCWISPSMFMNVFCGMTDKSLTHLELESVSLTGPISAQPEPSVSAGMSMTQHWPWLLAAGARPGSYFLLRRPMRLQGNNLQGYNNLVASFNAVSFLQNHNMLGNQWTTNPLQNARVGIPLSCNLPQPPNIPRPPPPNAGWRPFSWPHVLSILKPSALEPYLAQASPEEQHAHSAVIKDTWHRPPSSGELRSITLKSCGYAIVDHVRVNNWALIPQHFVPVLHRDTMRRELTVSDTRSMSCNDMMLGKILNYIPSEERQVLGTIPGTSFGWEGVYEQIVTDMAVADGNLAPGDGRFNVKIETEAETGAGGPAEEAEGGEEDH
ncbi:hypothetical protein NKR23_g7031 [Pleurostoma richardsiae]|uniref:F-box domain-containing protein n=1 Tax=Pleurostoma richardsiae TaxID=41990 RepID=A0AA38VNB6_9PEZI|nr:hypothetical protein NKR23_g7031 [Pleurostoma richardsiae]